MRKLAVGTCLLVALAGCGTTTTPQDLPTTTTTTTTTAATAVSTKASSTPSPQPKKQWTMPNLVGTNLQQAQDAIQKLTGNPLFLTTSHDATGKGRHQVADRNWKVCTQSVPAGGTFHSDTVVDFGAVKTGETC